MAALEAGGVDYVTKPIKPRGGHGPHGRAPGRSTQRPSGRTAGAQARNALDAFGYASITVRAVDGRIVWQTPLARELLQSYFGEPGPDGTPTAFGQWAPEPVQTWLRRRVLADNAAELLAHALAEPPRLAIEQGARRLTFRLHQQAGDSAGGGDWLLVMREVSDAKIIESMSLSFKLTAREAEVLYWVLKGQDQPRYWRHPGCQPRHGEEAPGARVRQAGRDPHGGSGHGDESHTAAASAV